MNHKYWQLTLAITTTLASSSAWAQERARVLSAVPVVQQVGVPQQFCEDVQIYSGPRHRSDRAVIVGEARDNQDAYAALRGHVQDQRRGGTSAAEVAAGSYLGNVIEDSYRQPRYDTARRCTNETVYEDRTVGYDVTYEYAGQRHTTRMNHNPGPWVPIQVPTPGRYSSTGNNSHAVTPGRSYQSTPQGSGVTESITYTQPSIPIVIGVDVEGGHRPSRPPHGHRPPPPPPPHWR